LQTGGGKGVNRNRITVYEINADRGFNLSADSFQRIGRFSTVAETQNATEPRVCPAPAFAVGTDK
jgi:hypothetical protein